MKTNVLQKILTAGISGGLLISLFLLQGCNTDEDKKREFSVQVFNLTSNQPFSPLAGLLHDESYSAYSLGEPASLALETLAEAGDNSLLTDDEELAQSKSGKKLLSPGKSETLKLKSKNGETRFTLLTMPVHTNDAFVGLNSIDLSELQIDESLMLYARIYDAGTEANTEAAAYVPGQGGEGFNAARDDRDFIVVHPGIVSQDDGLATSALNASHKFDNPGAKVIITRTK